MEFTPDEHCSRCHRCNELETPYERAQEARYLRYQYRYRCKGCGNRWQISEAATDQRICKAYLRPLASLGGALGNTTVECVLPAAYGHDWHDGFDGTRWKDSDERAGRR